MCRLLLSLLLLTPLLQPLGSPSNRIQVSKPVTTFSSSSVLKTVDADAAPSTAPAPSKLTIKLNNPVPAKEESEPPPKSGPQPRHPSLRDEAYYKSWPVLFRPEHMRNGPQTQQQQKQKQTQPAVPDPPPNIDPSLFDMELPSITIPDTPPLEQNLPNRFIIPTPDDALSAWPTKAQSVHEARQTPEHPKVKRKHKRPIKPASELRAADRQFTCQKPGAKDKSLWSPPGSTAPVPVIHVKEEPAF